MIDEEQLQRLVTKWTEGSEGYRAEARRLELTPEAAMQRHRDARAHAQAIHQCSLEPSTLTKS